MNYEINKTTFDVYGFQKVGFYVCRNSVYLARNILTRHRNHPFSYKGILYTMWRVSHLLGSDIWRRLVRSGGQHDSLSVLTLALAFSESCLLVIIAKISYQI